MEKFIDEARWSVDPEDFFLEFARGLAAILCAHGARPELESAAERVVVHSDAVCGRASVYAAEIVRDRLLAGSLAELVRPCLDVLSGPRAVSAWIARVASLTARPLAPEEPRSFFGAPPEALSALANSPLPFAFIPAGSADDWERLFLALVDYYGPGSEHRLVTSRPAWRPAWITLAGKADLDSALWPWVDKAIGLAGVVVMYLRGDSLTLQFPPEWLLARPRFDGDSLFLGGLLAQLPYLPGSPSALDPSAPLLCADSFPVWSQQIPVNIRPAPTESSA